MNQEGKLYERPWGTYRTIEQRENYQIKHIVTVKSISKSFLYVLLVLYKKGKFEDAILRKIDYN